jgi:hypothetical protein
MHSQHEYEYEDEPNLYKTRLRRWLAEYPYPLPTSDQLSGSGFTPEEIAEALAEAYAHQARRPPGRDLDDGYVEGAVEILVVCENRLASSD